MQACLGATYSWSVYVDPLKNLTGLLQGVVQLPFSLFYFCFPATLIVSSMFLLPKFGPRWCAMLGGAIFGGGWLLAMLGTESFGFTVIGIGLLGGIGAGLAYIVPITVCLEWFPRHRGLVTGIAVAGFGGGAAIVSLMAGILINRYGITPFTTFGVFGAMFMVTTMLCALSMKAGPDRIEGTVSRLGIMEIVSRREFRILYVAMCAGLATGFAVNANLRELYGGLSLRTGILGVSLFAVANALGRIGWGFASDRMRTSSVVIANLIAQTCVTLGAVWLTDTSTGFLCFAFLVGFNYGGVLVVYVSAVSRMWKTEHVGQVYGLLFSSNIVAAIAPVIVGLSYDVWSSFSGAMLALAALMVIASLPVARNACLIDVKP